VTGRSRAGSLLGFFSLTYAVAWTCWFAAAAVSGGTGSAGPALATLRTPLFYLGTFAPSLVALGLTARGGGRAGAQALLDRVFETRVPARWYVFAAGYVAAIKLTVALVHRVATGAWPTFGDTAWYVMLAAVAVSTPVQAGEEIGWRGYALPRLATRFGLGPASVILGLIWACWHLPLFFIPGTDTTGQSFPLYLLQVIALSVAIGWLYGQTKGSLLLVMLMHAAANNTKDIVPSAVRGAANALAWSTSLVAWLTVILLWICAGIFLARMPGRDMRSRHDIGLA
jgi:CAAX protease family protein